MPAKKEAWDYLRFLCNKRLEAFDKESAEIESEINDLTDRIAE